MFAAFWRCICVCAWPFLFTATFFSWFLRVWLVSITTYLYMYIQSRRGIGTFVARGSDKKTATLLIAVGGGGSHWCSYTAGAGVSTLDGTMAEDGVDNTGGVKGGRNGGGGESDFSRQGGGGAGFDGDGLQLHSSHTAAMSFRNGGTGGIGRSHDAGFGGGGTGAAGGGGGYSGGASGKDRATHPCGGGGGSFSSGANKQGANAANAGPGSVRIWTV